jgi:hypothetical protein
MPIVPPDPTAADPYFYGWREIDRQRPNGTFVRERIPLTEWDVLHPEEGDFIVQTDYHQLNCQYLFGAMQEHFAGRPDVKVFGDHRIDWQIRGLIPHGPDVSVFDGVRRSWDSSRGTFVVREMNVRPLLVIEVTSPSTRNVDLNQKVVEYFQAGVPFYLIVDLQNAGETGSTILIAYRTTPEGFVQMPIDPEKGVWIPTVRLWFKGEREFAYCYTEKGEKLLRHVEMVKRMQEANELLEKERQRAEQERQRAEDAIRQAERDRQEAEALRRKLKEAEDRLKVAEDSE